MDSEAQTLVRLKAEAYDLRNEVTGLTAFITEVAKELEITEDVTLEAIMAKLKEK